MALGVPHQWIVCAFCCSALAFIGFTNAFYFLNMDVVKNREIETTIENNSCPFSFTNSSWENRNLTFKLPDFYEVPNISNLADNAYYLGKISTIVPAGILADVGYSRYVLGGGMFMGMIRYLLLPSVSKMGHTVYVLLNFVEGVGYGSVRASIHTLLSWYTPASDRNFYIAILEASYYFGKALGNLIFELSINREDFWNFGAHLTGLLGLVWLVSWFAYMHCTLIKDASRQDQRTISESSSVGFVIKIVQKMKSIPWYKMCSSCPFLSLILAYLSLFWAVLLLSMEGEYEKYILHLPVTFTRRSIIFEIVLLPSMLLGGCFADWIIKHNDITKTSVKKCFAFFGVFFSSILQVSMVPVASCNIVLFWIMTITSVYIMGPARVVILSTSIDLSPRHAGLLIAIMDCVRTTSDLILSGIQSLILENQLNPNEWQHLFIFYSVLALVFIAPFIFFGSGENQQWDRRRPTRFISDQQAPQQL